MRRLLYICGFLFVLFVSGHVNTVWADDSVQDQTQHESEHRDHHHHDDHNHGHPHTHSDDFHSQAKVSDAAIVIPQQVYSLIAIYCALIVLASLIGGWLPSFIRLTHSGMQTLISGVGGLMLGIAIFHLLPHSLEYTENTGLTSIWLMGGLLVMFFMVRIFHFHHHGPAEQSTEEVSGQDASGLDDHHTCNHHHEHAVHHLNWIGVALGLALHTLIDGIALGASVRADASEADFGLLLGFGTFLAILLHKPLDAISITSLMEAGGWSTIARNIVNFTFAMMCPLGALLFLFGVGQMTTDQHTVIGCSLAFAAGVFLCISLGDLLPELELHSHNRIRLSLALLIGVALAWAIEQTHSHDHSHGVEQQSHENRH